MEKRNQTNGPLHELKQTYATVPLRFVLFPKRRCLDSEHGQASNKWETACNVHGLSLY